MDSIRIVKVEHFSGEDRCSTTVYMDNGEAYQLRVVPDSVGNVYVWVDHKMVNVGNRSAWNKVIELLNGKQRPL